MSTIVPPKNAETKKAMSQKTLVKEQTLVIDEVGLETCRY